ncbi:uncharacterized protein TRIADDRAFT_58609 [Trichoplax adhaerens]|uniref:L-seryl-tRNA(Sec) kinase n=1 Tax=Trichoplax adhaerens TaxID=10228 RepID=B3S362_TRIAD|nr:hypothetical protein TRIADDRAFT_58609 [Trichoplax adhaerens]EDV22733.1 hypothetical protein TRIADDRAFT_58609 [Trichoplax adhaerens]|eukprot:XP_002114599.1 hypothetical protein TRIADDRAFT_58609 [Trichoplax adhaerens]
MASQTVLLAVYGLPGAGKTSLIHRLISALPNHAQPLIPIHICYDSILPKEIDFQDSEDTIWKNMRQLILDCIEYYECFDDTLLPWQTNPDYREKWQIVKEMIQTAKKDSKRCLYILDDNFYYRSMRYKIYQLAKKHAWGYGQIWVKCPLEVAFRRNCNRVVPVAQATITKMDSKLEVANSSKFPWEDNNFIFESTNEDPDNWKMLLDFTIDTFSKPVVFISSTDELQKVYKLAKLNGGLLRNSICII